MSLEINIQNNTKNFNLNVNFQQNSGVLGLLGPSGSGKSMTLKAIAGLIEPTNRIIKFNDKILFSSEDKMNLSQH